MNQEHIIVKQVYDAKEDILSADELIGQYLPFIKSETAKFINRPPIVGHDDELSIAMIAFHEAIQSYDREKGSFFSLAALIIRNRLIDYWRANKKHNQVISLETKVMHNSEGSNITVGDQLVDESQDTEETVRLQATQDEIKELSEQMVDFGVSLSDIAENSPKQERTVEACQQAITIACKNEEIMTEFLRLKRLPMKQIVESSGVSKKTLERHRKYLVTMLLIYSNGYEIIRGHLSHMQKGGTGQ